VTLSRVTCRACRVVSLSRAQFILSGFAARRAEGMQPSSLCVGVWVCGCVGVWVWVRVRVRVRVRVGVWVCIHAYMYNIHIYM
jgi:hypothetical protein